jgi:type II secretory pathway pseudopilin PulG
MQRRNGYTYLGLLLAIVLAGTALAAAGSLWSTEARRSREAELLFVGDQFRDAIGAYWEKVPLGQSHVFPRSLGDLLDDKRWPTQRRHLRRLFVDPMTGTREWGLVEAPSGGIMGVYSRSEEVPLKRGLFPSAHAEFAQARTYRGWRFVYAPQGAASAPKPALVAP